VREGRDAAPGGEGAVREGARRQGQDGHAGGAREPCARGARGPHRREPRARGCRGACTQGRRRGARREGKGRKRKREREEERGAHLRDPNSGDHRLQDLGHHEEREREREMWDRRS
jgi:hypothetical protein